MTNPVRVVEADPDWADRAARLTAQLFDELGPAALGVEHIGSTSIPGMAAKDVLDMQVSVPDLSAADGFDAALAGLGFVRLPFERDHVPAGWDGHPGEWAKRFFQRREHPDGRVNLHVRRRGSANERLALLFRDWFRAHPTAVPPYAAFKQRLAAVVSDMDTYSDVKDPVVDLVIWMAEGWSRDTGWSPQLRPRPAR